MRISAQSHQLPRACTHRFEGSKGIEKKHWKTGKLAVQKRWVKFKKHRISHQLPVVGSLWIFRTQWKSHTEIIETGPTGHDICDDCIKYQVAYDKWNGKSGQTADAARSKADEEHAQHTFEHQGERKYGDDIWAKAEENPADVVSHHFDSPTQAQFGIPVQRRATFDVAKSLDNLEKWGSKIVGVMVAGWGVLMFAGRAGLGGGPNLTCTVLYCTLLMQVCFFICPHCKTA